MNRLRGDRPKFGKHISMGRKSDMRDLIVADIQRMNKESDQNISNNCNEFKNYIKVKNCNTPSYLSGGFVIDNSMGCKCRSKCCFFKYYPLRIF
jgi:hypothetical protein